MVVGALALIPAAGQGQTPVPIPVPMKPAPARIQPAKPQPAARKTLTVGECIAIGLDRQPAMKAALESLHSAELGKKALDNLPLIAGVVRPDLDFRKQAARRGVDVASAAVLKTHDEIIYDIGYLYFTYVYAHQQDTIVTDLVEQLGQIKKLIEDLLKSAVPDPRVTKLTLLQINDGLGQIQTLQSTARAGKKVALAALKEAMGVDPSFDFVPREVELPLMKGTTTLDQVVDLALSRRPELAMMAGGVDAFRLEVESQNKFRYRLIVQTLASGADLHSTAIPNAMRNGEYKPAPIVPEMPPSLLGSRQERVSRACSISLRQDAGYEKLVNLVRLEATKAFLTWQQDAETLVVATMRFNNAREMMNLAKSTQNLDKEKLIQYMVTAGKAQSDYLTAAHNYVKSLLVLERVTSGGVRPAFPGK
jgi:outer membrane protein TolC